MNLNGSFMGRELRIKFKMTKNDFKFFLPTMLERVIK